MFDLIMFDSFIKEFLFFRLFYKLGEERFVSFVMFFCKEFFNMEDRVI